MLPGQLSAASFAAWPPKAKSLATEQLPLLRRLPLAFVPLLLRELIVYDWKFPAERADFDRQFAYLGSLSREQFREAVSAFSGLKLTVALEQTDWVNSPAVFSEQLSAHLWATHQIDAFRAGAVDYVGKANAFLPDAAMPTHRLGIAIIGQGVDKNEYRLFRKLRAQGTCYSRVNPQDGMRSIRSVLEGRTKTGGLYSHWYIDGGPVTGVWDGMTLISYDALAAPRQTLQSRMQKTYEASVFDPEAFRTMLAQIKPEEAGLASGGDPVLNRFQLSLLTEGSGTQVFATTFVQWAAREVLRRAQPLTVLARFTPRQREKSMNELLSETQHRPELDPQGSLIDADMGAYYTWLNMQRLPGAEQSNFLVWFEGHSEAVAIGPSFERGKSDERPIELDTLVGRIT